uniref:Transcription factor n=1 Tax=Rhizophora mucronata TaxID=61149 RepID=A0A2P2JBS8_RHIMU
MYGHASEDFRGAKPPSWSHLMPASSPMSSCVTISSNMLDFSASKGDGRHPPPDRSPEVIVRVRNGKTATYPTKKFSI